MKLKNFGISKLHTLLVRNGLQAENHFMCLDVLIITSQIDIKYLLVILQLCEGEVHFRRTDCNASRENHFMPLNLLITSQCYIKYLLVIPQLSEGEEHFGRTDCKPRESLYTPEFTHHHKPK